LDEKRRHQDDPAAKQAQAHLSKKRFVFAKIGCAR
jgi:hypothetical protein